jgi:hypothetical protein
MDGETPETLGYRGAQYVRADVLEGRVREEREALVCALIAEKDDPRNAVEHPGFQAGMARALYMARTRPALASPSDSSGDDEGGTKDA